MATTATFHLPSELFNYHAETMENDNEIITDLNTSTMNTRLANRMKKRKENLYFDGYLFTRKDQKTIKKKTVITNKSLYFIQQACCISLTGITFAQKCQTTDFKELTVDTKRLSLVIHTSRDLDDLEIQMEDMPDNVWKILDYSKLVSMESLPKAGSYLRSLSCLNTNMDQPTEAEKIKTLLDNVIELQEK